MRQPAPTDSDSVKVLQLVKVAAHLARLYPLGTRVVQQEDPLRPTYHPVEMVRVGAVLLLLVGTQTLPQRVRDKGLAPLLTG